MSVDTIRDAAVRIEKTAINAGMKNPIAAFFDIAEDARNLIALLDSCPEGRAWLEVRGGFRWEDAAPQNGYWPARVVPDTRGAR